MTLKPVRAVYDQAVQKAADAAVAAGRPEPSDAELDAIGAEAERKDVYGHDYKTDRQGRLIPCGIGSKGRETINHLNSILRYEGRAAYEKELRRIWKETPDHARRSGFPEPERLGS